MAENRGDAKVRGNSLDPYHYRMDYPSMGTCVIINNRTFSTQRTRDGTDIDADNAVRTFQELGYKIKRVNDQTKGAMEDLLETVSQKDHSDSASFVCVLLSHGDEGIIYGTDGFTKLKTLTGYFRSGCCHKSLVAKPKLFFIQACSGDEKDYGCETDDTLDESSARVRIPMEADFFYAYSTAQGYVSWRSPDNGSWFMQALCERLKEHSSKLELMRIMTRVNHQVAWDFGNEFGKKKQIPCIISMLTKDFFFP